MLRQNMTGCRTAHDTPHVLSVLAGPAPSPGGAGSGRTGVSRGHTTGGVAALGGWRGLQTTGWTVSTPGAGLGGAHGVSPLRVGLERTGREGQECLPRLAVTSDLESHFVSSHSSACVSLRCDDARRVVYGLCGVLKAEHPHHPRPVQRNARRLRLRAGRRDHVTHTARARPQFRLFRAERHVSRAKA